MKTDPNQACANESQRLLWAIIHDALAHPLMVLTGYSKGSLKFHDYTSLKAWARSAKESKITVHTGDFTQLSAMEELLRANNIGFVSTSTPGAGVISYRLEVL